MTNQQTKYKDLTVDAVREALYALLDEGDTTTNLDIKEALREDGYFAVQEDVSNYMDQIVVEDFTDGLDFSFNGQYRTYFLRDDDDGDGNSIPGPFQQSAAPAGGPLPFDLDDDEDDDPSQAD